MGVRGNDRVKLWIREIRGTTDKAERSWVVTVKVEYLPRRESCGLTLNAHNV